MSKSLFFILFIASLLGFSTTVAAQDRPLYKLSPEHKVVSRAHELIGTPYRWGGNTVKSGFDCSGLMVYLFRSEAGIILPRTAATMFNVTKKTVERKNLKRGDVVFFKLNKRKPISHVGLYIGGGRFIHAPRTGAFTRIDSLSNSYWKKRYVAAKRLH